MNIFRFQAKVNYLNPAHHLCSVQTAGPMEPGQPMPGRMMSGPPSAGPPPGGIPPMMPPRHPGHPNGMCEYKTHPFLLYSLLSKQFNQTSLII